MLDQAQVVYQPPEPQLPPQPALSDILQAYREAASARSRQRLSGFVREYGAIGLRPGGGPETLLLVDKVDTEPMLFGIDIGRGRLAVFPGNDIVVGFATIYASQRNIPAEVSVAYQLEVDGSRIFRLIEPSIWTEAGGDAYGRTLHIDVETSPSCALGGTWIWRPKQTIGRPEQWKLGGCCGTEPPPAGTDVSLKADLSKVRVEPEPA